MSREAVNRLLDYLSASQLLDMFDQEVCFEGVWMVKVDLVGSQAFELAQVFIVRIVLDDNNSVLVQMLQNFICHCSLARGASARNADNE